MAQGLESQPTASAIARKRYVGIVEALPPLYGLVLTMHDLKITTSPFSTVKVTAYRIRQLVKNVFL